MRVYPRDILFTVVDNITRFEVPIILSTRAYTLSFLLRHNAKGEFRSLSCLSHTSPRECAFFHKLDTTPLVYDPRCKELS